MSEPTSDESMSAEPTAADLEPKRSWLTGKRLVGLALTVLILLRVAVELIPTPVIIGPETTFVDGPLRDDGTIDYAAALNDEWEAGVTPDQNAAVALLRAFGPRIVNEETREVYFARLGIPVPPLEGDYLVEYSEALEAEGLDRLADSDQANVLNLQFYTALEQPWAPDEFPEVAAWLDANQKPLEVIVDASRRPRYFSPIVETDDSSLLALPMATEHGARTAARLLVAQAMLELGRGNVERAFELTFACHRLSRHLSEHPTAIGMYIAYAMSQIASTGDDAIVLEGTLTADQAVAFRQQLAALPPFGELAAAYDHGERFIALDSVLALYSGRLDAEETGHPQFIKWCFDPNPALRQFNDLYDEIGRILALPDRAERVRELNDLDPQQFATKPTGKTIAFAVFVSFRRTVSEMIGNTFVALLCPAIGRSLDAQLRTQTCELLSDIGYALAAHQAKNGEYPESLDALVPEYLEAHPLDPYTGDRLKYELTEDAFVLYSVGPNDIDDGGQYRWPADDIAFGDTPDE